MIKRSIEWFVGSVAVYVLVVACGGARDASQSETDGSGRVSMGPGGLLGVLDDDEEREDRESRGDVPTVSRTGDGGGSTTTGGSSGKGGGGSIMNPVPDANAAEDGSRIVNLYRATSGGLRTPEGYWDNELDVRCDFARASDGTDRCFPVVVTASIAPTSFADPDCTEPAVVLPKDSCLDTVRTVEQSECGRAINVFTDYSLGKKLPTLYSKSGGECFELPPGESSEAFAVGDEIDPATYAEGSLEHE